MSKAFDRTKLLAAFDEVGGAAISAGTRLDIAVFGGSALMLAGNFRYATEDVDIAEIRRPWPDWLTEVVARIARHNDWSENWLNDAVTFHLSPVADPVRDLVAFGTFPRAGKAVGLTVFVPTAEYMLALKLKALRIADPAKGSQDVDDIRGLLSVLAVTNVEQAIEILARYFPRTATGADKQRFVLKRLLPAESTTDAPQYPIRDD
jgi:hypothetical protein